MTRRALRETDLVLIPAQFLLRIDGLNKTDHLRRVERAVIGHPLRPVKQLLRAS
jgi:hypothetical protein